MKRVAFRIFHLLRVYALLLRMSIMSRLTYPINAAMGFVNVSFDMVVYVVFANIIFDFVPSVGGFTRDQLYVIVGTMMILEMIGWLTFRSGVGTVPERIRRGEIEPAFVHPLPSQFTASFTRMDIEDTTRGAIGAWLILSHVHIPSPVLAHIVLYVITLAFASVIYFGFFSCITTLAFYVGKLDGLYGLFVRFNEVAQMPHTIITRRFQWIFFTILPTAFFGSVPTLVLTSNNHWLWLFVTAIAAAVAFFVTTHFWRIASRNYSGASG